MWSVGCGEKVEEKRGRGMLKVEARTWRKKSTKQEVGSDGWQEEDRRYMVNGEL